MKRIIDSEANGREAEDFLIRVIFNSTVTYSKLTAGYPSDQERAKKSGLVPGDTYRLSGVRVEASRTEYEIHGLWFNSVMFELNLALPETES